MKKATGKFANTINRRPNLVVRYIDGKHWELIQIKEEPFYFTVTSYDGLDCADVIMPPNGFKTDFASIPRFFWRILPPTGDGPRSDYGPAAVIHDFLYRNGGGKRAREYADAVFMAAMRELGVSFWRHRVMYRAVRMFGKLTFGKDMTKNKG